MKIFKLYLFVYLLILINLNINSEDKKNIGDVIINDLTPKESGKLINDNLKNPDFIIVDVRTQNEFDEGHIEKAVNIDYYSQTFKNDLNALDRSKKYFFYCRSGNRSGKAVKIMKELGFKEVYNLSGGIIAWNTAGFKLVK